MPDFIKFIINSRLVLLFLIIEIFSFIRILHTHSYHYAKTANVFGEIRGNIQATTHRLHDYLNLKKENIELIRENENLKNELEKLQMIPSVGIQSGDSVKFAYIAARVIHNSYRKEQNILTLDKGARDGVKPDMGVVLPNGIVGVTLQVSEHFSTVLSLLNRQTGVNVRLKKNNYTGNITWDATDYRYVFIEDLPVQSQIKAGDSVETGNYSLLFPEGIPVGTVENFKMENKEYRDVKLKLFADFSALDRVYIVKNRLAAEQLKLESKNEK